MVQYRDLNAPPARTLAEIVADMRASERQSKTGDAGVKDLGEAGDVVWPRPDGTPVSVRDVDLDLADARQRIEDAEEALTETDTRLTAAEESVQEVRDELDNIEFEGGSNNFYQPEPPLPTDDPAPSEGSIWFDTNDQNKPYIYRGGEWLSARDDSFLSTARNLTPWSSGTGDAHALAGQAFSGPSGEVKLQPGVFPNFPTLETVGIVLDLESDEPGAASTTTLPFQGAVSTPGSASSWTETAMPYEGRPIGVSGTVLFGIVGTPIIGAQLTIEASFFDAAGVPLGTRRRAIVNARELDSEDPTEGTYLDGYGFTHIAVADSVLEPNADIAPDVASFAMSWHIRLPRTSGSVAAIIAAEARVQVPESGIAAGAITTPKIATGAITAESGIIGSIDAGTITVGEMEAERLKVNDALAARVVQAMDIETKKLVVTDEAILNHATLIGQTVVDDINVQGKLVGADGVFTGTVDFENVNVTGELLANEISGEYLYGTVVEGGEIRTGSDGSRGSFLLGDRAYVSPVDGYAAPGLQLEAPGREYTYPPGLGIDGGSVSVSSGRAVDGRYGQLQVNHGGVSAVVSPAPGDTAHWGSRFSVDNTRARLSAGQPAALDGAEVLVSGPVILNGQEVSNAVVRLVVDHNGKSSRIEAGGGTTVVESSDGTTKRSLKIDGTGVWVTTNRSGVTESWNLEETASDTGWIDGTVLPGFAANQGNVPQVRRQGSSVTMRRGVNNTGLSANGSFEVFSFPPELAPNEWKYIPIAGSSVAATGMAVITSAGRVTLRTSSTLSPYYLFDAVRWDVD